MFSHRRFQNLRNFAISGAIVAISFLVGMAMGHYRLPPYNYLKDLKDRALSIGVIETVVTRISKEPSANIVMFGDSLTEHGHWSRLFERSDIWNFGVSGDSSAGILNRVSQVASKRPQMVFVLAGVNDIYADFPSDVTERNLQLTATQLQRSGAKPVIQTIIFIRGPRASEINARISAINTNLAAWCARENIAFVDLNSVLSQNGSLRDDVTKDGIHLNDKGYQIWRDAIRPYLRDASR